MGLLNPGALIFASLYAVLVLLYLWERVRRRLEVPSLLLWRSVPEDIVQARRFRPDWLFLLQLLLLAGLIAGLARPYLRDGRAAAAARRHIFILDTSASMQARESGGTRFEAARTELRRRCAALPADDEAMLITAASRPQVLADFTRDRAAFTRALDGVRPTDTGTQLDLALALAAGARQRTDVGTEVQLFSDLPPSQLPPRWQAAAARGELAVEQFGETDANLAITGLQIFQGRFEDAPAARANVVVQNFSHREGQGVLTVRLEETPVLRTGFSIPARELRSFHASGFPGPGRVTVQLDAQVDGGDALPADNQALGWIRPLAAMRVLLISAPGPLTDELKTIAAATPALQLGVLAPEAYAPSATGGADVVIFHRFVPATPPPAAAMYIDPPPGNPLFAVAGAVHGVELLDWNDRHPALGGLQPLTALPIQRAHVVLPAEWHEPLLLARTAEREFALAFAGEQNGQRVACIAFDLEAERLLSSDHVSFLLFFLNLVSWLAPPRDAVTTTMTGRVVSLSDLPPVPVTAIDPDGQRLELGRGGSASLEPLSAGEYRISADGVAGSVYANFLDPVESDIGRAGKQSLSVPPAIEPARAAVDATGPGREFGWWLLAGGAGLLLLEWLAATRR
ncbi:MAG: VWA domain-containing protein [Deltaproteobacteria bacterium]|nr:VWA domain-containing protein [Deltaproteobacteria bacterium]